MFSLPLRYENEGGESDAAVEHIWSCPGPLLSYLHPQKRGQAPAPVLSYLQKAQRGDRLWNGLTA